MHCYAHPSLYDADIEIECRLKTSKGATIFPQYLDPKRSGDVSGIYFVLSRADAEALPDREEAERDEENE